MAKKMKTGRAAQLLEARRAVIDARFRQYPRRGRAAAEAYVDAFLGPEGRRNLAEAESLVVEKTVRETLKRRARESAGRGTIRETLTAAAAPALPGAGLAPAVHGGDGGSLADALGSGHESPFWGVPGGAAVNDAPTVPADGLHSLGADELRDFSKSAFGASARARGFGSPVWQG